MAEPYATTRLDALRKLRREGYAVVDKERAGQVGFTLIARERARQMTEEGWTPEHDDEHDCSEMTMAASAYCWAAQVAESMESTEADLRRMVPEYWPWSLDWWKPSVDPIRNLVKAGALVAAEIDRLTRAAASGSEGSDG